MLTTGCTEVYAPNNQKEKKKKKKRKKCYVGQCAEGELKMYFSQKHKSLFLKTLFTSIFTLSQMDLLYTNPCPNYLVMLQHAII